MSELSPEIRQQLMHAKPLGAEKTEEDLIKSLSMPSEAF